VIYGSSAGAAAAVFTANTKIASDIAAAATILNVLIVHPLPGRNLGEVITGAIGPICAGD
jgi:hypothetical protein